MITKYNSRNRVFSITLSQEIMENYLKKRGYQISTFSQVAKDFGIYGRRTYGGIKTIS